MSQLSQITQQNASSSEELASTAEEMSDSAEQLQQLVGFFNVGDSGASATVRTGASRAPKPKVAVAMASTSHLHDEADFVKF
jgi:methyl-accepting chemotaxis protein